MASGQPDRKVANQLVTNGGDSVVIKKNIPERPTANINNTPPKLVYGWDKMDSPESAQLDKDAWLDMLVTEEGEFERMMKNPPPTKS